MNAGRAFPILGTPRSAKPRNVFPEGGPHRLTTYERGRPAAPWQRQSGKYRSQAQRNPMLLFEFEAALFQFDEREPAFAPLFQLPPKIAALMPGRPLLFLPLDPGMQHTPDFGHQSLCRFELVVAHTFLSVKKSHPKSAMRQTRIRRI